MTDWNAWNPKNYLQTYFPTNRLGPDSYAAWEFLVRELKNSNLANANVLDFGSGPTLFSAMACVPYAGRIDLCDYLATNLQEIQLWLDDDPNAFSWRECISEVLKIEGIDPSTNNISERELLLRNKIKELKKCDAGKKPPVDIGCDYNLIVSTYCVDSATDSKEVWQLYMNNLLSLLKPGALFLLTALRNCKEYKVGELSFPCANINESDMENLLRENGFKENNFSIEIEGATERKEEGFEGLIFVKIKN